MAAARPAAQRSASTGAQKGANPAANRGGKSSATMGPMKKLVKKMGSSPKKDKEKQEKAERLLKIFCVRKMQRMFRINRIRHAVRAVHELEDIVLDGQPTQGSEAYQILFDGPNPETTGGAVGYELAMRLHGPDISLRKGQASDAGSQMSRGTGKAGSAMSGSRQGSRQGSARSQGSSRSQRSGGSERDAPQLSEELFHFRLNEWGVENPGNVARLIFWILECDGELSPEDLDTIYRHHRIRRRNMVSRVVLHLILVLHGESDWLGAAEREDGSQPLLPQGWAQVTRTGWLLRAAGAAWLPGLVLRGSTQCMEETAERVRLIADDGGEQGAVNAESRNSSKVSRRSSSAVRRRSKMGQQEEPISYSFPVARVCDALDFPRPNRKNKLDCPATYDIGRELGKIIRAIEPPRKSPKDQPKEATPVLLVAGATVLELLIACLTGGRPREECLTSRLTGGDMVLLTSPFMCQLSGEGKNEKWRTNSELWSEAMRRDDWQVQQHLRGDGRGLPEEEGGFPPPPSPLFKRKPDAKWINSDIRSAWNSYAGAPLILGERDYTLLRQRAGLETTPLQEHVKRALKPLTKLAPATPPPETVEEEEGKDDTRQQAGGPAGMGGPPRRFALNQGFAGFPGGAAGTPL